MQREREAEGEEFKDKESFVTSAYKKKLEELRELEEQEKREEYLEAIGDVRKQGNLDGFYRHLYDQKVNKSGGDDAVEKIVTEKVATDDVPTSTKRASSDDDENPVKEKKKRHYRKREDSNSHDEEPVDKDLSHLPSNLDADSDFSIDSGSDSETEAAPKKVVAEKEEAVKPAEVIKEEEKVEVKVEKVEEVVVEKPKKPKIDIWKKRTIGVVFDEALQRYYERKAQRESG